MARAVGRSVALSISPPRTPIYQLVARVLEDHLSTRAAWRRDVDPHTAARTFEERIADLRAMLDELDQRTLHRVWRINVPTGDADEAIAPFELADLHDLESKVVTAMGLRGARYLHVLVPCPLGWGSASAETIRLARLATQSGMFPVLEAHRGEVTAVTPIRQWVTVEEYLRPQQRFAHLFRDAGRPDVVAALQERADRTIARFGLLQEED